MKNKKSLGQHWLKDRFVLDDIASLARLNTSSDLCLEIGPGLGTLTSALLRVFKEIIAVEFDEALANNLPKSFPGKNLKVQNEDFLKFDLENLPTPYVAAGNIPYYITSPIIEKLLTTQNLPEKVVLLIQKEVAERIAAVDGKQSLLSLFVQNHANVELGPIVERELFTPPPKVDSQIIVLTPRKSPRVSESSLDLAKIGFSSPRKKLSKNLSTIASREDISEALTALGLSSDVRPAELSLENWENLAKTLNKH